MVQLRLPVEVCDPTMEPEVQYLSYRLLVTERVFKGVNVRRCVISKDGSECEEGVDAEYVKLDADAVRSECSLSVVMRRTSNTIAPRKHVTQEKKQCARARK